nr:stefin 3_1 [Myxidium lieberkuehni]
MVIVGFLFLFSFLSLTSAIKLGGYANYKPASSMETILYMQAIPQVTEQNSEVKVTGNSIPLNLLKDVVTMQVKSQIVSGTNYIYAVTLKSASNQLIFVKIFAPLPYLNSRPKVVSVAIRESDL